MTDENQELRKAGLKVTLPRLKILQILESSGEEAQHLSAEDVYLAYRLLDKETDAFGGVCIEICKRHLIAQYSAA